MISYKRLKKGMTAAQEALTWESAAGWFPAGRSRDRPADQNSALKISAFYRAVDLRSDSIGRLPVSVRDLKVRREAEGHYLGPVLWERPNEAMSPFVYKKLVEYQRLVLGNCYVWIFRDRYGRAEELLPLPPGTCQPYVDPVNGKLWYFAQNPKTHEPYRLHPEDILHYKGLSLNGLEGLSLLGCAARALRVAESRDRYEEDVYQNGGRPSGVLSTDSDLSRKANVTLPDGSKVSYQDAIRKEWERVHSGPGNSFRVAVLDNSLKYTPISMTSADMQFVEGKSISVADIGRFTGVPLHLLFEGKQSYESNEQNSLDYVKYCLQPAVTQYEEEDSKKLLTASERRRGLWVCRNMMAELRGDTASRREWYRTMREVGAFSVNDILELEDRPDVPGGDTRYAPLNYAPLEHWSEAARNGGSQERRQKRKRKGVIAWQRQFLRRTWRSSTGFPSRR